MQVQHAAKRARIDEGGAAAAGPSAAAPEAEEEAAEAAALRRILENEVQVGAAASLLPQLGCYSIHLYGLGRRCLPESWHGGQQYAEQRMVAGMCGNTPVVSLPVPRNLLTHCPSFICNPSTTVARPQHYAEHAGPQLPQGELQ